MNYILFDDQYRDHLLPLVFTRPTAELRVGILKIMEKWQRHLEGEFSFLTADYLRFKFPQRTGQDNLYINGGLCPDPQLREALLQLGPGEALRQGERLLAARPRSGWNEEALIAEAAEYQGDCRLITEPYHLFQYNAEQLEADFNLLTEGRSSAPLSTSNTVIGDRRRIFVEEGVKAEGAIFNVNDGPIYLGTESEVMEGSIVRGGLALCEHSVLKMGAKIYGATTIGPHSKVGGELNNSVIIGYSNKGHDGFLGNSVIGEWCNLGADTNNSNLKNNYDEVKLWSYVKASFRKTGLQFCGLIMGDHSKCGINTMFNTGTVVGVSANIFGAGFPRNFIPSFSWGGAAGFSEYKLDKALQTAELVMQRRDVALDAVERDILQAIFDKTAVYR